MLRWIKDHPVELSSMFIALLALFTAVYQAELARNHNRLSVVPIILFESSEIDHVMSFVNQGNGPGIIQGLELVFEGKYYTEISAHKYSKIVADIIELKNLKLSGKDYSITAGEGFMVLKPGERIELLKLENKKRAKEFVQLMGMINFGVCYKSVYGDRFFVKTFNFDVPGDSCNYDKSIKLFGSRYHFHNPLNKPINPSELLGK